MKVTPQTHLTKANKYEVKKINTVERIDQLNEAVKSLGVERTMEICAYLAVIKTPLDWLETNKEKEIYIFKHNGNVQYFYIN